jgi:hypothetical protein
MNKMDKNAMVEYVELPGGKRFDMCIERILDKKRPISFKCLTFMPDVIFYIWRDDPWKSRQRLTSAPLKRS